MTTFKAYVIPESLHPLLRSVGRIVRKTRLGEFWTSVLKKYGRGMLDQKQVEWIVEAKKKGRLTNDEIARTRSISVSRVQQLHREYRRTGSIPILKKAGRPKAPEITDEERCRQARLRSVQDVRLLPGACHPLPPRNQNQP